MQAVLTFSKDDFTVVQNTGISLSFLGALYLLVVVASSKEKLLSNSNPEPEAREKIDFSIANIAIEKNQSVKRIEGKHSL